MDLREIVTVINRTSNPLKGTFDGRHHVIPPGESRFTYEQALFFRKQNPIMGRGTPLEEWSSRSEYLIGIKESGDDCSPIEQTNAPQRWDADAVNGPGRYDVVRSRAPQFSEAKVQQPKDAANVGFARNS